MNELKQNVHIPNTVKKNWLLNSNDSGVAFLRFLAGRKSDKLARLDTEIKLVKDQLVPLRNGEEYKEHSKNLLKTFEKEENYQKLKEKEKFH